jgi:hypothetical protein
MDLAYLFLVSASAASGIQGRSVTSRKRATSDRNRRFFIEAPFNRDVKEYH